MKKIAVLFLTLVMAIGLSACTGGLDDVLDCIENPDDPACQVCEDGYTLEGTECVLDEEPLVCDTGYSEVDGECVLDEEPLVCDTGYSEVDGECVLDEEPLVCDTGYSEVDGECVLDEEPLVCDSGYSEVDGECVLDEEPLVCDTGYVIVGDACVLVVTDQELLADLIVEAFDTTGSIGFITLSMAQIDFSTALTLTTEFYMEVTEDIDEVHYIDVTMTDSYVYAETGDMIKRVMYLDFEGEIIEFEMIFHEVDTGVHVYLQPEIIIDAISDGNTDILDQLGYVGFNSTWAVFEFDDTLENIIEIEVLKEMIVSLFFSEMGQLYFYELQVDLEAEIGFDLDQYNVDLGLLIDELIEEDYTEVELMLSNIDIDGIILNFDYLYLAGHLYEVLIEFEAELIAAGFDETKLDTLLTATYDIEGELLTSIDPMVDGTLGTEAFFASLTEDEIEDLIEVVIKPALEEAILDALIEGAETRDYWDNDLESILMTYEAELASHTTPFISATEVIELQAMGAVEYWKQLTPEEMELILNNVYWSEGNPKYDYWHGDLIWEIESYIEFEVEIAELITAHTTELDAVTGIDAAALVLSLETIGLEAFVATLTPLQVEAVMELYAYPILVDLETAINNGEALEFLVEEFFTDPHVVAALASGEYFPFDETIIADNMIAIDFDALQLELEALTEADLELLAKAIYDGQVAFDVYVATLAATAPNLASYFEIWSPAVLELEPYMIYVDDLQYAFDGLIIFDGYLDYQYYLDNAADIDVSKTEDFEILTIIEFDGLAYASMFDDILTDLNTYLLGFDTIGFPFDENWECVDPLDEFCEEPEFDDGIAGLTMAGSMYGYILYDPSDLTWAELGIDLTDFLDTVVYESNKWLLEDSNYVPNEYEDVLTGVNEFTLTVTVENSATVTLPDATDVDNVNEIADRLARFAVTMEAYDMLEDIAYYYEQNPTELVGLFNTDVPLSDYEFLNVSAAFDADASYVTISIDMIGLPGFEAPDPTGDSLDFEIVLVWIDGTDVFDETVGIAELAPLFLADNLVSQAAYDLLVGKVDETTFNTTKLFLLYLWEPDNDESLENTPRN